MKIVATVHEAEEGGYWAEVPALPGCVTEADTMQDLELMLKDAIEGWLAVANERETEQEIVFKQNLFSFGDDGSMQRN